MAMVVSGIVLFSFIAGAILIIVFSVLKRKSSRCSVQIKGQIIEIIQNDIDSGGGSTFVYSYNVNSNDYKLKTGSSSKLKNEIGDDAVIWYNPKNPKDAMAVRYSNKTYNILIAIGIVMVLLPIILFCIGFYVSQIHFNAA